MTKEELAKELERQKQRFTDIYGGEVTTYAAQPAPDKRPWRKRDSLRDQAFKKDLERAEKELNERKAKA